MTTLAQGQTDTIPVSDSQTIDIWSSGGALVTVTVTSAITGLVGSRTYGPDAFRHTVAAVAGGGSVSLRCSQGTAGYNTHAAGVTLLTADRTISAADDGAVFAASTALTLTIPASLSPRPFFICDCPPSGNLSIAVSGGAQINGATSTLVRTRATNPAGVTVMPHQDADSYGVSGS